MDKRAKELIKLLSLCPHPEGGYYREIFRSETKIKSPKNKKTRIAVWQPVFIFFCRRRSEHDFYRLLHDEPGTFTKVTRWN
jgi:predicted cupin superfamily sugar epimerase